MSTWVWCTISFLCLLLEKDGQANEGRRHSDKDTFGDSSVLLSGLFSNVNIVPFALKKKQGQYTCLTLCTSSYAIPHLWNNLKQCYVQMTWFPNPSRAQLSLQSFLSSSTDHQVHASHLKREREKKGGTLSSKCAFRESKADWQNSVWKKRLQADIDLNKSFNITMGNSSWRVKILNKLGGKNWKMMTQTVHNIFCPEYYSGSLNLDNN